MSDPLSRGRAAYNEGRFHEARDLFARAAADGGGPEATLFLAHAEASLGRPKKAQAALRALLRKSPGHGQARLALAALLAAEGRSSQAQAQLRAAAARGSAREPARDALARLLRERSLAHERAGRAAAALSCAEQSLRLRPRDAQTRARVAELRTRAARDAARLGRWPRAFSLLKAVRREDPAGADAPAFSWAQEALRDGAAARALACLRLLSRAAAVRPDARLAKAEALERLGRLPAAEAELAALAKRGSAPEAARRLSALLVRRAKAQGGTAAVALLQRALRAQPEDPNAREALAEHLRGRVRKLALSGRWPALRAAKARLEALDATGLRVGLNMDPALRPAGERGVTEARALGDAGRWRDLEALGRRALRAPDGLPAALEAAAQLHWRGRVPEAKRLHALLRGADLAALAPRERFRALIRLGRFAEAFPLGESLLDGAVLEDLQAFGYPWPLGQLDAARAEHLPILDALKPGALAPWAHYYRGLLRGGEAALADFGPLERAGPRYRWMLFRSGWAHHYQGRFADAVRLLSASLEFQPPDYRAHGFLAEAFICLEQPERGLREFQRGLRAAPGPEALSMLGWRGEALLWLGRYDEALADLNRACEFGPLWSLCWRAGAKVKLGRFKDAVQDLDRLLAAYPLDREAFVWRGEARRELGQHALALQDLSREPVGVWARVNRALVHDALGDEVARDEDARALPRAMLEFTRRAAKLPPGAGTRETLEAALRLAKGFRRDDYGQAVWMGRAAMRPDA